MAGILDIGITGLLAHQRSLNTTGHNIANSDTVGFSRQRTLTATQVPQLTGAGWVGSGVKTVGIERLYDDFLATQVRSAQSATSELSTYFDHAARIDNILADPNIGLDPAIQRFFDAMQVLADDPSSVSSRQLLLSESQTLVDRFTDLNRQYTDMRHQLNQELKDVTGEINSLAESLARVNQNIIEAIGASGGDDPNDLLDRREVLLNELAKRVDLTTVPQDDGAWNVFIGKGQALVMGGAAATLDTQPSSSDASQLEIVFTTQSGSQVITNQLSGGEIAGLLGFRRQILDPAQQQLGLVAVGISDRVNSQHRLGLDLNGQLGGALFNDPTLPVITDNTNAGSVTVSAAFVNTGNLVASDYLLEASGADQYTLTRLNDQQTTVINTGGSYPFTTTEIDGFNLTISGNASLGDKFLVRPVRDAAERLTLQISDPRLLAAAGPVRTVAGDNADTGGPNTGNGKVSQPQVSNTLNLPLAAPIDLVFRADNGTGNPGFVVTGGPGGTLDYDPATEGNGKSFTFAGYGGMVFTVSGTPAEGDHFVLEHNGAGAGDNRNALLLAQLQTGNTLLGETGGVSETATFQEAYGQLVSDVGSKTRNALVNQEATAGLLQRHQQALSSVNGVNLDEEAANLVRFQQAYQASAQVIAVANTLFDTLIGAFRN